MEPMLSITSLPLSPHSYGKSSEDKRPSPPNPQKIYDGTFVQAATTLKDEDENKAIVAWIYRGEDAFEQTTSSHEIDTKYYGKGLHLMKCFGYKGNSHIGVNNKELLKSIEATSRHK